MQVKQHALFISNKKFLDPSFPEGGVKFCTDEFIALVKEKYELIFFGVDYTDSFLYRLTKRTGSSVYNDYNISAYQAALSKLLLNQPIKQVFLNLSNTAPFASLIKSIDPSVKVILCSHGNESGDFLHDIAAHDKFTGIRRATAFHSIGKMLVKESQFREDIDLVLTVSEVEENIEKWLGAKRVYMVPRTISKTDPAPTPVPGRVGFLSDLSHEPNFSGISKLCESIAGKGAQGIVLRLAGSGKDRGILLENKYPFVQYLGHLPETALHAEMQSWTFALNPVFYYSRGVSTKLGKMLAAGIPAITTEKGMRGYKWEQGSLPVCADAAEMASLVLTNANDPECVARYREQVRLIQQSAPALPAIMNEISKLLQCI